MLYGVEAKNAATVVPALKNMQSLTHLVLNETLVKKEELREELAKALPLLKSLYFVEY